MSFSIYYIITGEFNREHKSVFMGKVRHLNDLERTEANRFMLRRNIHRLEKGLLMRPMKKVFAVNYVEETVNCYKSLLKLQQDGFIVDNDELKWAYDVLQKYFDVTDSHTVIDKMEKLFYESEHGNYKNEESKTSYIPYTRNFESRPNVSYEDLLELAKFRRSVRWFKPEKVPTEVIDNAVRIAAFSPSACNRQPFKIRFFDDPNLLKEISELPMGTKGYSSNIPVMAAVIGDLSAYPFERDRHLIYIDSSLAAMSFILALETQGVSSCIINWPDIESREKEISKFLELKEYERVVMLIGLGYPDETGKVAYSQKKNLNELRQYNI